MYAKARIGLLALVALFVLLPSAGKSQSRQRMAVPEDMERWIKTTFAKGHVPPFSFVYDGKPSAQFIRKWKYSASKGASDEAGTIKYLFTYTDPVTGLKVACRVTGFEEFGAVEWMLYFTNTSQRNSAMLTDVKVTDFGMEAGKDASFTLHHAVGSNGGRDDFWPLSTPVEANKSVYITPEGGRSSDHTGFPFMNLEASNGRGAIVAVGWTGNWYVDVSQQTPGTATLASGMKNMNLYLLPDETIRTPLVCMLFWQGEDRMVGHNTFRRFMLAHHSPKLNGRFAEYPFSGGYSWGDPAPCNEYCCLTEDFALALTKRYAQFGIVPEVFWLDAGWHTGAGDFRHGKSWANTTGNWTVDRERFPEGLKPVSDAVHETGAKFMVWFEPERVVKGTQWATEHKEWMLDTQWPEGSEQSTWYLFDLGNDAACDWLCKYYGDLIEENGIDYYRQDFNMLPAGYWRDADQPGRSGIKEIRHIENLYKFWDYLLDRFPGLLIDNCASGGKRLDWESIGRSAPLWRSDYYHYDDPDGYQCHTYGLNFFLPIHGTGILLPDQYSFRSSLSSALQCNWKVTEPGVSVLDMQQRIKEYRDIREYYYEDYYPLSGTGDLTGSDVWLAYQMHRPSDGSGIVVAFRRQDAPDAEYIVRLGGLAPDASYTLVDCDTQAETVRSGRELTEGLTLRLDNPRSSLLIKYRKN